MAIPNRHSLPYSTTAASPSPPDLEFMQLESHRQSSNTSPGRASPESGAGGAVQHASGEEGKLWPMSGKELKRGRKEVRSTDKSCLRCRLRKVRVRSSAEEEGS